MFQEQFLVAIKERIGTNRSLNDALAQALDISYDAAHRRSSGKSKLSLDETVVLASTYGVALDGLFATSSEEIIAVEKTKVISNAAELEDYFRRSTTSLAQLSNAKGQRILYSAKDIPLFYLLKGDVLTQFKVYVWLKLLDAPDIADSFTTFQIPLSLLEAAKELGRVYTTVPKTEIWDITTVNSTLKQIHFYFQAGLLESEDALVLCVLVKELIYDVREALNHSTLGFKLYHNELLLMNNQVLVSNDSFTALYVPFTMLSYFLCMDNETTREAQNYFDKQMRHSKLLNAAGEKEQHAFINKMIEKIQALENVIVATKVLDFQ